MVKQQSSKSGKGKNIVKTGFKWIKIVVYIIIFYAVYSIIVSIIRFVSPIFKALRDFFGPGDAGKPGVTGAPWWAWFGMAWYLLPAGALGTAASGLYKKFKFHNPNMTDADIAKLTNYTEEEIAAERAKPENKNLSEKEFSAKMFRENATPKLVDFTQNKQNDFQKQADATQDAAAKAEFQKQADEAGEQKKELEEEGAKDAANIEGGGK
jgi:hypothetical protein